jgi:signal transduction histidine kinase
MSLIHFKSIRTYLLFLFLLIFIPLFTIIFFNAREQKKSLEQIVTSGVTQMVNNLTEQQKFFEANTRQLLIVLSRLNEIRNLDTSSINLMLASLVLENPNYASMILVDAGGNLIASNKGFQKINVSDRKYYKDVVKTKCFAVGEYIQDRLAHRPALHYAYPVLNSDSTIKSILVLSFDIKYYDNVLKSLHGRKDVDFAFVDHCGKILYCSSDSNASGVSERKDILDIIAGKKSSGIFRAAGNDQIDRFFAFRQLSSGNNEPYMFVYARVSEKSYVEYHRALIINIIIWVLAALFVITSTFIFSRKYILKPIDKLVKTTDIIAEGNLETPTSSDKPPTELGKLAVSIDDMRKKLLKREVAQKKVEKDLKKLKERFELAINSADIGIWDWHIRNDVLVWGKNMFSLYGISPEQFDNTFDAWKSLIYEEDLNRFESEIKSAIEGQKSFRSEFRIVDPVFGIKYIRIYASVINDKENKPVRLIGVNWDITERKKLEYQLNEARENAETKNRLKSAFLTNISHEIRTPLHGIIGFAQILKDNEITIQERAQYLDIILSSGNKLLTTISNIIDISMLDAGKLKLVENDCRIYNNLHEVFEFYERIRIKEKKQIQFSLNTNLTEDFLVKIDGLRFNQIFYNLIDNAFKNTNEGKVQIGCTVYDDEIQCYVKDTGIGIENDGLAKIFDHFKKSEDGINIGNGLGFSICKGLVELMDGRIWAVSKDSGCEFYFTIPLKTSTNRHSDVSYDESNLRF